MTVGQSKVGGRMGPTRGFLAEDDGRFSFQFWQYPLMSRCTNSAALAALLSKGRAKGQSGEDGREVLQTLACRFKSREARSVGAFRSCCHVVLEGSAARGGAVS